MLRLMQLLDDSTPETFRSRVAEVFGPLEGHKNAVAPTWSLSQQQVFRPGKDEAYSSDEDREAQAQDQARRELLPGSLIDFEGAPALPEAQRR